MTRNLTTLLLIIGFCTLNFGTGPFTNSLCAQTNHSVARQWNEQLLEAIRNDFARPVVHARNLYHTSAAMYDCWSLITGEGTTALMGTWQDDYFIPINRAAIPDYGDREAAINEAISHAAYQLLIWRYNIAPGREGIRSRAQQLMFDLGYNPNDVNTNLASGDPAALGNVVAREIIRFGLQDGANEQTDYENWDYPEPTNPPLVLDRPFSIFNLSDPNSWQALAFPGVIIDQSGNILDGNVQSFLGASWGRVRPFALSADDRTDPTPENPVRGESPVYHDPGPPPLYDLEGGDTVGTNHYRWGFETVLKWSGHLDPADGVMIDISPASQGNNTIPYPTDYASYPEFYDDREGGQRGDVGHAVNPATGQPYAPNVVPRGDYTRVLAEFWADGPASETPPGHWFVILNEKVLDHPDLDRRIGGTGPLLGQLEYDLKAYLLLGGTMHDAAITAWSIKGKYDYIRPISAIRYLCVRGQATDPDHRSYNERGIRLDPGYIEVLNNSGEIVNPPTLGTVKARAWVGTDAIVDPEVDVAGVDWMNPSLWVPYQRPTFVTPNFAGYVSGHSTYSSAAAQVLTAITGTEYFPGGMAEFVAEQNEFLVFEEGPSQTITLQWATYRDASDQTSLSRIWGGIHPPADDIPGRIIGIEIGEDAYERAVAIFDGTLVSTDPAAAVVQPELFPNPVRAGDLINLRLPEGTTASSVFELRDLNGRLLRSVTATGELTRISTADCVPGLYFVRSGDGRVAGKVMVLP